MPFQIRNPQSDIPNLTSIPANRWVNAGAHARTFMLECPPFWPGYFMNSRLGVTATTDMAVLPGVLGCRPLRRTFQVRLWTDTLRSAVGGFMKYSG